MGLDWWTFTAQIVNLFVLIWLLKRFLYRPILEAIDKRQAEINAQVKSAQQAKEEAEKEKAEWEAERAQFDSMRQKRLNALAQEEQDLRKQATLDIRKVEREKRSELQQSLNIEMETLQDEIRTLVGKQFLTLSQKVFRELTEDAPMDAVVKTIQNKIRTLSKKQKFEIEKSLSKQNIISISTSIALSKNQQKSLLQILKKTWAISTKTRFVWETNSDLILGIEIRIGNSLLEWNLKNYLDELTTNIHSVTETLILSEKDG